MECLSLSLSQAVCLDHTSDGRKVDLGLKCWRWGRADDNELTFWELRRFVHALCRWEQKRVLPSRVIKRSRTEWANLFRSLGWFWDDVFTECSQRCRAVEGAIQIQVRAEFAVQTKAALAILVQWVVLRHRNRARTTARAMLCGFLKMLLHGREYRKSFLPTMGARCQHTLPDSTDVQGEMRVPERFVGEARSLAADGGTPEYHGDACDAPRRPEMLGGPLHICELRRVFVVGHGERLCVGHEERSNGATSSQQWQSSSASVRGHETEIHAHPRDAAETGHRD